jgi:hypothetical protein
LTAKGCALDTSSTAQLLNTQPLSTMANPK